MDLKAVSTADLFNELRTREGVQEVIAYPYVGYSVHVNEDGDDGPVDIDETGPASILIVTD